uniref:Uncharacterized protein n=1 Tax=Rhizobium loti TaxID=381 RepID=Q8KGR0_RHILI|nr:HYPOTHETICAL PROTEIN [Mesorhizobium japonicum R7A]
MAGAQPSLDCCRRSKRGSVPTLNGRQNLRPHDAKHGIVRPVALRHDVMRRLGRSLDTTKLHRAAIGSTLLRSPSKKQQPRAGATRSV